VTVTAVAAVSASMLLVPVGRHRQAVLLAASGLLLLVGRLTTLDQGSAILRSSMTAALPLALCLAGLSLATRVGGGATLIAAGGIVAGPGRALFYDPIRDLDCLACGSGALALRPDLGVATWLALTGLLLVVAGAVVSALRPGPPVTHVVLAVLAGWASLGHASPPGVEPMAVLLAVVLAAGSGTYPAARTYAVRRRIRRLTIGLTTAGAPDQLLAEAFGDPSLRVLFPVSSDGRTLLVDTAGRETTPPADTRQTPAVDGIAVLLHTRDLPSWAPWPPGPELRLGLSCARLDALLAMQQAELASSRSRLLARADAEARAIERDLHDGAQQHLLALGVELQLSRAAEPAEAQPGLDAALAEVGRCLDELRDISHGIYPPTLGMSGLAAAVRALARGEGVEVSSLRIAEARMPDLVERTAYLVVLEVVGSRDDPLDVSGALDDGVFRMTVNRPAPMSDSLVYDRLAAIDGTIETSSSETVVSIPCA
jgi:signal transduction histidine kinase